MNKTEFIRKCAEKTEISQKNVREILNAFGEVILEGMKDSDGVTPFPGMTFKSTYVEGRMGRNPSTGEPIEIAGRYRPKVKFGKSVKEYLNA